MKLYHGGAKGLWRGDLILPDMVEHRCVDGCPVCEAHRRGDHHPLDPATPPGRVFATTNRRYARFYASRAVGGDLYQVELVGDAQASTTDPFPSWSAPSARVLRVLERDVVLTMRERRDLFRRWGGTPEEFEAMLRQIEALFRSEEHAARFVARLRH